MTDKQFDLELERMAQHRQQWEKDFNQRERDWQKNFDQRAKHWLINAFIASTSAIVAFIGIIQYFKQ